MKKRNLILLLLLVCVTLFGCTREEEGTIERNTSFGKYTGVYKLDDVKAYVFHNDDIVQLLVYKGSDFVGNPGGFLEDDILDDLDLKIEFSEEELKVEASEGASFKSGTYKYFNGYDTDTIYKDHVGDVKYFDYKINGKYENDDFDLFVVRSSEDMIKILVVGEEFSYGNELNIKSELEYYGDSNKTTLIVNDDGSIELTIDPDDEDFVSVNGKYSNKTKVTKEEIIKNFAN